MNLLTTYKTIVLLLYWQTISLESESAQDLGIKVYIVLNMITAILMTLTPQRRNKELWKQ